MAARANEKNIRIQEIVNEIIQKNTVETIADQESTITFAQLQKSANMFLNELALLSNASHGSLLQKMQKTSDMINLLYGEMRASSSYTQQVLQLQHHFENELNKFLNRTIYLTYVGEEGEIIAYDEVAIGQIYKQATANLGRGNINPKTLKSILSTDKQVKDVNESLRKSVSKRQQVYLTAVKRWESNGDEGNKKYNPSFHTFYWRLNKDNHITGWTGKIDSRGVIAEGYAEAVINNRTDVINSAMEISLFNLWHNYIKKDSVPAAVKGDVVLKDDGSIQFAIKEGQFSTAKVGQYINLAYNILQLSSDTTKQNFSLALPKLLSVGKTSNKIINIINKNAEDTVFQLVKANLSGKKLDSNQWKVAVEIIKGN